MSLLKGQNKFIRRQKCGNITGFRILGSKMEIHEALQELD